MAEAVAAAHRENPAIEGARLSVRAAREDVWQARAGYWPSVTLQGVSGERELEIAQQGALGPIINNLDQTTSSLSAIARQKLFTGGLRGAQLRIAQSGVEGARQDLRLTEQDVLLRAVQAYVTLVRDEAIVTARSDYASSLTVQLNATRRRLELGEATSTDLSQANARLFGARAQLAEARAAAQSSRAEYVAVIGVEPDGFAPVSGPKNVPASLEEALAWTALNHPRIRAARENEQAARARIIAERANQFPQLSLVARSDSIKNTDQLEQQRDSTSLTAELTIPLFDGGYAWSRTRQGKFAAAQAGKVVELARREAAATVTAAWYELTASREVVKAAQEQLVAAEDAVRGAERELTLGTRSSTDVLDARLEQLSAEIELLRVRARADIAGYALAAAMGMLTLDSFEPLGDVRAYNAD